MTEQTSGYTMGYSEDFLRMLHRRSAQTHAAYLLPRLEPGMRLLDFGCGPGTISVGLAKAIEPGELHGIDLEESQVLMARAAAEAGEHTNATFHVGDVTALPFEDDSFDVAHCHAVLMHIPDTQAVLAEVKRVLKPGGMIASREMIGSSSFMAPDLGNSDAWATFARLIAANGGHPEMGKELKGVLLEAGFTGIRASASFDFFGTSEDIAFFHAVATGWFFSNEVMGAATKYGLATQEQFDAWRVATDQWRDHAGSIGAVGFGEAIASKSYSRTEDMGTG
ncbi:MAG: methyltransferase domain-containing protein [Chloroflexi bacterium]|nr:methyltransferase domain-containing protein [Chloroflexota bacterium]